MRNSSNGKINEKHTAAEINETYMYINTKRTVELQS